MSYLNRLHWLTTPSNRPTTHKGVVEGGCRSGRQSVSKAAVVAAVVVVVVWGREGIDGFVVDWVAGRVDSRLVAILVSVW